MQLCQEGGVCNVCQTLEHSKEHGCAKDVEGLPLAKDHNSHGKEACAGHAHLKVPGLHRGHNVGHTADCAQCTGNDNTGIAHLVDIDAHRVRCLRMLAAGTQTQAKAGLVQHHIADDQQNDAQRHKNAQLQPADAEQEGPVGVVQLCTAAIAEILGKDHRDGRGQQVQGRAADSLIRLQVDGGKGQQQTVHHTGQCRHQNRDQHHEEDRHFGRQHGQGENTRHTANDHDAFQCDVDDAGVLTEHTAQCHQHQNDAIQQRIFDQKQHITCPPFRLQILQEQQALRSHWFYRHS